LHAGGCPGEYHDKRSQRARQAALRYDCGGADPVALEELLRQGQQEGEFRMFDTRVWL